MEVWLEHSTRGVHPRRWIPGRGPVDSPLAASTLPGGGAKAIMVADLWIRRRSSMLLRTVFGIDHRGCRGIGGSGRLNGSDRWRLIMLDIIYLETAIASCIVRWPANRVSTGQTDVPWQKKRFRRETAILVHFYQFVRAFSAIFSGFSATRRVL